MAKPEQIPDLTFALYGGKVTIDFYQKYVTHGHAYNHVYIHRETGDWPISVTGATGMVDKSRPLMIWQENLTKNHLLSMISGKKKIVIAEEQIIEATSLHRVKKEEGSRVGDLVHKWAEDFTAGKNPPEPTDEKVKNGVNGFLKWLDKNEVEIVTAEQIVYSKEHDFVGKLDVMFRTKIPGWGNKKYDCIGDYKTKNWTADKKTGVRTSVLRPEERYQTAGYKLGWEEEHGIGSTGARFILAFDKETGEFTTHIIDEYEKDSAAFLAALTLKKRDKELAKKH